MIEQARAERARRGGGLALIAGLALAARLLPLPLIARWLPRVSESGFAEDGTGFYLPLARSIAERGEFGFTPNVPSPDHVPLYPALLAGLLTLQLSSPVWIAAVQASLGAAALVLLYIWVSRLVGPVQAVVATVWAVILPDFAVYSYLNMSENLGIVFVLATLVLFEEAIRSDGLRLWIFAGISVGLAGLTREFAITLLLPLAVAACARAGMLRAAGRMGVMTLAAAVTILPWMIRNYRVFGEVIPLSAKGGVNLYIGTQEGSYHPSDPRRNWELDPRQSEVERNLRRDLAAAKTPLESNRLYLRAAWQNIADDPWGQIVYLAKKTTFFWQPNIGLRHRERIGMVPILAYSEVSYSLCLLLAACSLLMWRFAPAALGMLALLIGWTFIFHLFVGEAEPRYHFNLLPAVFACAGVTLAATWQWARRRDSGVSSDPRTV